MVYLLIKKSRNLMIPTQYMVSPRPTTPPNYQETDRVIYCTDNLRLPLALY
jgi:hypothetical protein